MSTWLVALLLLVPMLQAEPAPAGKADAGKAFWQGQMCSFCHGTAGEGGWGPDLAGRALTVAQFKQRIQGCLDETKDEEPDGWLEVVGWYRQAERSVRTSTARGRLMTASWRQRKDGPSDMRAARGPTLRASGTAVQRCSARLRGLDSAKG